MINPFRSESDAFRLLVGAVVAIGAIGIAAIAGGLWPALIVFVVLTVGRRALVGAGASGRALRRKRARAHTQPGERRILVVANETVGGETLRKHDRGAEPRRQSRGPRRALPR